MKKLFAILCMLIMTAAIMSGCGKLSDKELYSKAIRMPFGISYDAVVKELGKPTKILEENKNKKTGEVITGSYVWAIEGMDDGWLEIHTGGPWGFKKTGYCDLFISKDFARKIAMDNKLIIDGTFTNKLQDEVEWAIKFDKLTYGRLVEYMKKEGVVLRQTAYMTDYNGTNSMPETTYIWFDKEGNSVTAKFENRKFPRTQYGNNRVGSTKYSKLSGVELYKKSLNIPYKATLDEVVKELGEPTKIINEMINGKTGALSFGTYLWGVEGVNDEWIEVSLAKPKSFTKTGVTSVNISADLVRKVAIEKKLSYNGTFTQKMVNGIKYHLSQNNMPYNKLKELMKCEGIVGGKGYSQDFSGYKSPTTTFVWFDKEGNRFEARYNDK